ncbi:MAG: TetR/AcrR family transcriptional regulator [Oscillospiraceae bacterium]
MKNKENQRVALTKRLLKEQLLRLMSEKKIQNITVSELCSAAEINRSTFYNHYCSPEDVLKDIENGVISDLEEIWNKNSSGKDFPINKRVELLCNYLYENKKWVKPLFRDSDTNSAFARLLFNAAHVHSIFERVFPHLDDENDRKLICTFLNNGSYQMIRQWLVDDIPKTPKEVSELIYFIACQSWGNLI